MLSAPHDSGGLRSHEPVQDEVPHLLVQRLLQEVPRPVSTAEDMKRIFPLLRAQEMRLDAVLPYRDGMIQLFGRTITDMSDVFFGIFHDKPVVVKMVHKNLVGYDHFLGRAKREANFLEQRNNDSTRYWPRFLGAATGSHPLECRQAEYFVMEFVSGIPLNKLIGKKPDLCKNPALAAFILIQLAHAVSIFHKDQATGRLYVNRDLAPHNIFLAHAQPAQPVVQLIDANCLWEQGSELTQPGRFWGRMRYVAPEIILSYRQRRRPELDHRVDIYTLGCVLLEMLSGQPPWEEASSEDAVMESCITVAPDLPDSPLSALAARMLAKNPFDRPSLDEIREICASFLRTHPLRHFAGPAYSGLLKDKLPQRCSWTFMDALNPASPYDLLRSLPGEPPRDDAEWEAFAKLHYGMTVTDEAVINAMRIRFKAMVLGGQAQIFFGRSADPPHSPVAVKCVDLRRTNDSVLQTRFKLERSFLAGRADITGSSYWPKLLDESEDAPLRFPTFMLQNTPCAVLELIPGISLEWLIHEYPHIAKDPAFAAAVGIFVIHALEEIHEAGLVNRDVKPGNVLITHLNPGQPFVKLVDPGSIYYPEADRLTPRGLALGTPEFMSPEQCGADGMALDRRSDYYSLGCLLYYMLAGQLPFAGRCHEVMHRQITEPPCPLNAPLWPVITRLLEKDPKNRPLNPRGIRRALLKYALRDPHLAAHLGPAVEDIKSVYWK